MELQPLELTNKIEQRYIRYLKTTFHFKDPALRQSFADALDSGHLSRGPYIEAIPIFQKARTPEILFGEILKQQLDEKFLKAIDGKRSLYLHQEQAISKIFQGRNIIVATGTGSGKTEAFLYPILLHLYQEFLAGTLNEKGVRALILYPMNALANDQRKRLGDICDKLQQEKSPFKFSFGQYIGETPEDEKDERRQPKEHLANKKPGELVFRREMRVNPPHILLTNYSMLEYLLIRPDDSPLFDNDRAKHWIFLVLDEAHQYRGAKGMEMGMLIRRLKQRLIEGGRSLPFRCIATSATLAEGAKDIPAVAQFASDLFGEKFDADDVLLGKTVLLSGEGKYELATNDYELIFKAIQGKSSENLMSLARRLNLSIDEPYDLSRLAGKILQNDRRALRLRQLITDLPQEFSQAAKNMFPDLPVDEGQAAISLLIDLLQKADGSEVKGSPTPLLSTRYHFFLRSLEGAFISYLPMKKIFLDRKKSDDAALFELAVCRNCGQHYLVGQIKNGKLGEAIRDPGAEDLGVQFFRPIENIGENIEEEEDEDDNTEQENKKKYQLCLVCGSISRSALICGHEKQILVIQEDSPDDDYRADQMSKCGVCGYHAAGRDPVREIIHGHDGPNAVIATTLYQHLPEGRKKILAFADSRQEAAFFAWYLENSYKDILNRNLILKAIVEIGPHSSEGLSLCTIANELINSYQKYQIFSESMDQLTLKKEAWLRLYREFLTDETRISLEGVGLVRWRIKFPKQFQIPQILFTPPWSLKEQESLDLIFLLLNYMRLDRAVEIRTQPGASFNWAELNLQAPQTRIRIGSPGKQKNVKSWDSSYGRRGRFMTKLLLSINPNISEEQAKSAAEEGLRHIWQALKNCNQNSSSGNGLLIPLDDACRLNPDWWRAYPILESGKIFCCNTCGRLQTLNVRGICSEYRCHGKLQELEINNLEPNHYRLLYMNELPGILRSEEHTAQLSPEKAREFQSDFVDGQIHVLSSSTTFELGVDLGDLDLVFLRNIPPEAFNYAQRVGRTGRRMGNPGIAISYCRRNPHDIYHFLEPHKIIKGKISPPILRITNQKIILRHITAVTLSSFFRRYWNRFYDSFGKSRVECFFKDLEHPTAVSDFKAFLEANRTEIEQSLQQIIPKEIAEGIGFSESAWILKIADRYLNEMNEIVDSTFLKAELEILNDYMNVKKLEEDASKKRDYEKAKWARDRANTIADEDVLSFLSRKAVIPKYGFPVDVVELDTHQTKTYESMEVRLQRDLSIAISEYAPTSKVIANKKEWESYGIKKVAEREWEIKYYKKCNKHNYFKSWKPGELEPTDVCCEKVSDPYSYLIPKFGFITRREKPKDPKGRVERLFSTRPFFAGFAGSGLGKINYSFCELLKATPGIMIVICEGRKGNQFYICTECGAGFRNREKPPHQSPFNKNCSGTLQRFSLGHEFITDVVQLRFSLKPPQACKDLVGFAYSLAYAIMEGASEVLEVPSIDLNTTVGHISETNILPPIVLYDNVPGGAGLVARLEDEKIFFECLNAALLKVNGKCCCESSCYGCLRSYRNQFVHQRLDRQLVFEFLKGILTK